MTNELSRADFLKVSAAVVMGPSLLPIAKAMAEQTSCPLVKGLNTVYYDDPEIRQFTTGGGADALVLWPPSWKALEPKKGELNEAQWENYDIAVTNAIADKKPIYAAVDSKLPDWAATSPLHAPKDRTPDGPWARYLGSIIHRHPQINGIIAMNEPNLEYVHDKDIALHTAEMIRTADYVLHKSGYTGRLLVPATSDFINPSDFTEDVLKQLKGWRSYSKIGWAHHSYSDIKENTFHRADKVIDLLRTHKWAGGNRLWITETGYIFDTHETRRHNEFDYDKPLVPQEKAQVHNVIRNFEWAKRTGRIAMWANYTYRDRAWGGGGFMSGLVRIDGSPHPILKKWHTLESS